MNVELLIQNGSKVYAPVVEQGIVWDTERKGSPGKLTFTVIKDQNINFTEGNPVRLTVDGVNLFYGFIFTKYGLRGILSQPALLTALPAIRASNNFLPLISIKTAPIR